MDYIQIIAGLVFFMTFTGLLPVCPAKRTPLYRVYHSDSCKYFDAYTRKDANEWLAATYDDAILFDGFTGETIAIILRSNKV